MQVIEEEFEDAGEQDAQGVYDFYYSGTIYRFVFPARELRARCYSDTPGHADFLGFCRSEGQRGLFESIPYDDLEFREAAMYLRDKVADSVRVLLPNGYAPVDFRRFPGASSSGSNAGELFHCFQCRAVIPQGHEKCPNCGWTWE